MYVSLFVCKKKIIRSNNVDKTKTGNKPNNAKKKNEINTRNEYRWNCKYVVTISCFMQFKNIQLHHPQLTTHISIIKKKDTKEYEKKSPPTITQL